MGNDYEYSEDNLPKEQYRRQERSKYTDKELVEAYQKYGSFRKTAKALGLSFESVRRRVNRHRVDPALKEAMTAVGTNLTPRLAYIKTHKKGDPTYTVMLAPEKVSDENRVEDIIERVGSIEPIPLIKPPKKCDKDTISVYPIFDAHLGLRSLKSVVGEDYNTKIACEFIRDAMGRCVNKAEKSKRAIIINGGDFTHADNDDNETPQSKHKLDVELTHEETIDAAIELAATTIEMAAQKHTEVVYRQLRGNHDPSTTIALKYSLRERYRNNPNITIDCGGAEFFVTEFGKTMIVGHHGDKATWNRLAVFIPDAWPEMWGRTKWRYCLSGHLHREKTMDIGGLHFETCRAATKPDRYANTHAYSGKSQLRVITYHREYGECDRGVVNY